MRGRRLKQTLRLYTLLTSGKRTQYLKEKEVFGEIGDNCNIMSRTVPLYPELIKLGNNVRIASGVTFITHDVSHVMLNDHPDLGGEIFKEKIGCIEIKDNVFIGAGSTILYGVQIGTNVIVGAGSLVNKDIPSNSIVAGVPAKVIETFEDYLEKRRAEWSLPNSLLPAGEEICADAVDLCWREFYQKHTK